MAMEIVANRSVKRVRIVGPNLLKYANENRQQDYFNDVCLITDDNEKISANRMVLSCHSFFFERMFKTNMKEKYERDVEIHSIDGKAMKAVVDYIYEGSVVIDMDNVTTLLSAADYMQLDEMKAFCCEFLGNAIAIDNCFAILSTSISYRNKNLSNRAHQFISRHLCELAETNDFKSLSKEDLINCLSKLDRRLTKETIVYESMCVWVKHDEESRKEAFYDLLQLLDFRKICSKYLSEVVSAEELVQKNHACLEFVTAILSKGTNNTPKIISIGGSKTPNKVIEVFSQSGKFPTTFPDLPQGVSSHASIEFNGYVYCLGGVLNNRRSDTKRVWRTAVEGDDIFQWIEICPMQKKRMCFGVAVFDETIVVAGGYKEKCGYFEPFNTGMDSVECYIAKLNQWIFINSLIRRRTDHALVATAEGLYALGGDVEGYNEKQSSVERLASLNGSWQYRCSMNINRINLAAVNCNGLIYAIGGRSPTSSIGNLNSVERYNSDDDKWVFVSSMQFKRRGPAACVLEGMIYVVGGSNSEGEIVKEVECFDPDKNAWFTVGKIEEDLSNHAVIAL